MKFEWEAPNPLYNGSQAPWIRYDTALLSIFQRSLQVSMLSGLDAGQKLNISISAGYFSGDRCFRNWQGGGKEGRRGSSTMGYGWGSVYGCMELLKWFMCGLWMVHCKTDMTPLLMHWSYFSFAWTHWHPSEWVIRFNGLSGDIRQRGPYIPS